MQKRLTLIIMVLAVVLINLAGCKDKTADTESDIVKSDAEYKQEAEKEINKDNLLDELDKLEKSVDQDTE